MMLPTDPNPDDAKTKNDGSDSPSENEMPDADAIDARIASGAARHDAEAAFGGEAESDNAASAADSQPS